MLVLSQIGRNGYPIKAANVTIKTTHKTDSHLNCEEASLPEPTSIDYRYMA